MEAMYKGKTARLIGPVRKLQGYGRHYFLGFLVMDQGRQKSFATSTRPTKPSSPT